MIGLIKWIEISNALSMLVPLREFCKQRKRILHNNNDNTIECVGGLKSYELCFLFNVLTSLTYHTSCAFTLVWEHRLANTALRIVDISAIHILTGVCGSDALNNEGYDRRLRALWKAAIVPLNIHTIYTTAKEPYKECPKRRTVIAMASMSPMLLRAKRNANALRLLAIGGLCGYTYKKGITVPIYHTLFHFLLGPLVRESIMILKAIRN